jgi:transcriptional regulator with XRE-family HTH domain
MKKTPNRSLRRLREILGKNQQDFAGMLGVSVDLIKSLECGRAVLTDKMAMRILFSTGARVGVWRKGSKPAVLEPFIDGTVLNAWLKAPYTLGDFERHQQRRGSDQKSADVALGEVMPELKALFHAAAKPGPAGLKNRLPGLAVSLWDWIWENDERFKLGTEFPPVGGGYLFPTADEMNAAVKNLESRKPKVLKSGVIGWLHRMPRPRAGLPDTRKPSPRSVKRA